MRTDYANHFTTEAVLVYFRKATGIKIPLFFYFHVTDKLFFEVLVLKVIVVVEVITGRLKDKSIRFHYTNY